MLLHKDKQNKKEQRQHGEMNKEIHTIQNRVFGIIHASSTLVELNKNVPNSIWLRKAKLPRVAES